MSPLAPCAWAGPVGEFLSIPPADVLALLTHHLRETGSPQLYAWRNSLEELTVGLRDALPEVSECGLVLEYELPRSGGRRPDLIFLNNGVILVIEFKNRMAPEASDLDQVLGYVRELSEYHEGCRNKTLLPVLVPIGFKDPPRDEMGVRIVAPRDLAKIIKDIAGHRRARPPSTGEWIQASYEPLPHIVEAARLLFEKQPLPRIRTASAENIPARVARMEEIITQTLKKGERRLLLVTGVPGSGKTLIGLQLAHARNLGAPALMLSGNGPLVDVLQHILGAKEFVRNLKNHLRDEHVLRRPPSPARVVIFDEAQRAWDRDRVMSKHQGELVESEPTLLLSLASRVPGGYVIVGLVGQGQELHAGEELGIQNWVEAIAKMPGWSVAGPAVFKNEFEKVNLAYETEPLFSLGVSLRSKKGGQVSAWVEHVLAGELDAASTLADQLIRVGYSLRMSRNLESLKAYIRNRFDGEPTKRTGMIMSSKFRKAEEYGIHSAPQRFYYYGQWYEEPESHRKSGCRLETAISEFGCQGLELDLPLLCWGTDLTWEGTAWVPHLGKPRVVKDPHRLRINSYRVLLTRGRDGLAIFIPPIPALDSTSAALGRAGVTSC